LVPVGEGVVLVETVGPARVGAGVVLAGGEGAGHVAGQVVTHGPLIAVPVLGAGFEVCAFVPSVHPVVEGDGPRPTHLPPPVVLTHWLRHLTSRAGDEAHAGQTLVRQVLRECRGGERQQRHQEPRGHTSQHPVVGGVHVYLSPLLGYQRSVASGWRR